MQASDVAGDDGEEITVSVCGRRSGATAAGRRAHRAVGRGCARGGVGVSLAVISYGGGGQSTAMLVLAAQGQLGCNIDTALFANVGDDSEHPGTLRYVREVAIPWAAEHGLDVHELHRTRRDGTVETLYGRLTREGSRSLPIPVRMDNGAPGTRSCTADFKIRVVGKWLREHGASEADPATVCVGISVDEIHRANNRRSEKHERVVYPLLELGYRRVDCERLIRDTPLPASLAPRLRDIVYELPSVTRADLLRSDFTRLPRPPKSSCFFCPFHRPSAWQAMRIEEPDLFEKAADLEDLLNARRDELGKDHVYLTRFGGPLRKVIPDGVAFLPLADDGGSGGCDGGWCAA